MADEAPRDDRKRPRPDESSRPPEKRMANEKRVPEYIKEKRKNPRYDPHPDATDRPGVGYGRWKTKEPPKPKPPPSPKPKGWVIDNPNPQVMPPQAFADKPEWGLYDDQTGKRWDDDDTRTYRDMKEAEAYEREQYSLDPNYDPLMWLGQQPMHQIDVMRTIRQTKIDEDEKRDMFEFHNQRKEEARIRERDAILGKQSVRAVSLEELGDKILEHIWSYLPEEDTLNFRLLNKRFAKIGAKFHFGYKDPPPAKQYPLKGISEDEAIQKLGELLSVNPENLTAETARQYNTNEADLVDYFVNSWSDDGDSLGFNAPGAYEFFQTNYLPRFWQFAQQAEQLIPNTPMKNVRQSLLKDRYSNSGQGEALDAERLGWQYTLLSQFYDRLVDQPVSMQRVTTRGQWIAGLNEASPAHLAMMLDPLVKAHVNQFAWTALATDTQIQNDRIDHFSDSPELWMNLLARDVVDAENAPPGSRRAPFNYDRLAQVFTQYSGMRPHYQMTNWFHSMSLLNQTSMHRLITNQVKHYFKTDIRPKLRQLYGVKRELGDYENIIPYKNVLTYHS